MARMVSWAQPKVEPYEKVGHSFGPRRGFHVHVCQNCGLIALSNDLTAEAIRLGCDFRFYPGWKKLVRKHTGVQFDG